MSCPACQALRAAGEDVRSCRGCETIARQARAWRPGAPASDLATLARWLPDLSPRALEPCPLTPGPGHSGPSAHALDGRPDRIDDSRGYSRAVAVWRHLRELVAVGQGEDVAVLWGAYGLTADGWTPAVLAARVATGFAPPTLRQEWHEDGRQPGASPRLRTALVVAWGQEALGCLWTPGVVPVALAVAVATGFAGEARRARWELLRHRSPALVASEACAWGGERLAGAEGVYRDG